MKSKGKTQCLYDRKRQAVMPHYLLKDMMEPLPLIRQLGQRDTWGERAKFHSTVSINAQDNTLKSYESPAK